MVAVGRTFSTSSPSWDASALEHDTSTTIIKCWMDDVLKIQILAMATGLMIDRRSLL